MERACKLCIKNIYLTHGDQNRPQIIKIHPKSYSLFPKTFMKIHFWYFGEKNQISIGPHLVVPGTTVTPGLLL